MRYATLTTVLFITCMASSIALADQPVKRVGHPYRTQLRTQEQMVQLIQELEATGRTPAQRVAQMAQRAVGTPYALNASMFSHKEVDCVTLVEQVLALGLADSWESYHQIITRLRYKDGQLPFGPEAFSIIDGRIVPNDPAQEPMSLWNRNHFIVLEWDHNNQWCLEDLTKELGQSEIKPWIPLHHIARPRQMFAKRGLEVDLPPQKVVDAFIPREALPEVISEIKAGDIIQVIVGPLEDRHCNHMGIVVFRHGYSSKYDDTYMVHACPPKVRCEPLPLFINSRPSIQGFKLLRLRADAKEAAARESQTMAARMIVPVPSADK